MKEKYDIARYFPGNIPNDVKTEIHIDGTRPLKSGSKFKVKGERGEFVFLYVRLNTITCFDPLGRFITIDKNRVSRSINRTKREIHS